MATNGCASITPSTAPAPHSTRLSASSVRRSAPRPAPSAARTASSPSRRTERARIRLAMFKHAMTNTTAAAASNTRRIVRARGLERDAGRESAEELRHPMRPVGDHRGPQMMRARHNVRDDLGVSRIRDRRLEDADHRGGPRTETDGRADDIRVAVERRRPEPVSEDRRPGRVGTIVIRVQQAAEHRAKAHHVEERTTDDARLDHAGLAAETTQREVHRGEVAEGGDGRDARLEVVQFRYRERDVLGAEAGGTLADVDQLIFVAIDEGAEEHAPDDAENRGVGADTERERHHDRGGEAPGAQE